MKKIFLIISFFYLKFIYPIQPTAPSFDISKILPIEPSTLFELEEKSKKPDFIRHGNTGFSWGRIFNFYDKYIFFDKDISGKPIYKKISEHAADNARFGKVILVLYFPKKKYKNQFVIVGTYSNQIARKKLLRRMQTFFGYTKEGAIWCPKQNAIIAGTNNPKINKKFKVWLKQQNNRYQKEIRHSLCQNLCA